MGESVFLGSLFGNHFARDAKPTVRYLGSFGGEVVVARLDESVRWSHRRSPTGELLIMVRITIKLPDLLARTFGATPEARSQRLTEEGAVEEYRAGRLSH